MFQCRLEAQPDHLTPAWLLAERSAADDAADALDFSDGITQQDSTLWVPDPATRVLSPYALQPSTWQLLRRWRYDGRPPPVPLLRLLYAAGIVSSAPQRATQSRDWKATVAACRNAMQQGYAPVRGLIHPYQLGALRRHYRRLIRRNRLRLGDPQCPLRYVAHNEPAAAFFHRQLTHAVSALLGKVVKPSYCYFVGYQGGAELVRHVDREQCEYTLALCIDFSPEPARATPWPLQLQRADTTVVVHQAIGDALLYRGREIPHFRDRLAQGCTSSSILFHYVDQGFTGPFE
jgi:hypothetical protein